MTLTPEQQWDSFTDEQKVEWLATKVMGWTIQTAPDYIHLHAVDEAGNVMNENGWNPLTDWNHWRQVEEKVMESDPLSWNFEEKLGIDATNIQSVNKYIVTDLPTRCKALYLAYSSLNV